MVRISIAVVVASLLSSWSVPVEADTGSGADRAYYFGVGFGANATLQDKLGDTFDTDGQVFGRVLAGHAIDGWGIEASFFGTDLSLPDEPGSHSTLSLGIGARRQLVLMDHIRAYVRGGVDYTWLARCPGKPDRAPSGFAGPGYDYGVGLEAFWHVRNQGGNVSPGTLAVWLDAGRHVFDLSDGRSPSIDGELTMIGVGFSVSYEN